VPGDDACQLERPQTIGSVRVLMPFADAFELTERRVPPPSSWMSSGVHFAATISPVDETALRAKVDVLELLCLHPVVSLHVIRAGEDRSSGSLDVASTATLLLTRLPQVRIDKPPQRGVCGCRSYSYLTR
jgi:hypothetical protein